MQTFRYEGQCHEVDRLYPALEVRLFLSASLPIKSSFKNSLPMAIALSTTVGVVPGGGGGLWQPLSRTSPIFDNDSWTPRPCHSDEDEAAEDLEDVDDIFDMSGSSNASESRNEHEFDEEGSLYSDALSRKASAVSKNFQNFPPMKF